MRLEISGVKFFGGAETERSACASEKRETPLEYAIIILQKSHNKCNQQHIPTDVGRTFYSFVTE